LWEAPDGAGKRRTGKRDGQPLAVATTGQSALGPGHVIGGKTMRMQPVI